MPLNPDRLPAGWQSRYSAALLCLLTLACLLPFCGEAFHVDDTVFVWVAQQIARHPLDPYGFNVVWFHTALPVPQIMNNPPFVSYYMAAAASVMGWSEIALHIAFLLPALAVVLGTYYLARRFTRNPLLAAAATLFTPGFLVSGTSTMCDMTMVAAWVLAMVVWLEGLDKDKPLLLCFAGLLASVCALSKYFGLALIPLLFAYTLFRRRDLAERILYLLIPVVVVAAYECWARQTYGEGLLSHATGFADRAAPGLTFKRLATVLVGLAYVGGCALTALTFAPVLWPRRQVLLALVPAWLLGRSCVMGWYGAGPVLTPNENWIGLQLAFFIAGGVSVCALAAADWRRYRNADSLLLVLWIAGTFVFTVFVNWAVNARSVLPLLPAVGILLARRMDQLPPLPGLNRRALFSLAFAAVVSLWVTAGDAQLANSARAAAQYFRDSAGKNPEKLGFVGRWGFEYYMQAYGFRPVDPADYKPRNGDTIVVAENNAHFSTSILPAYIGAARWHREEMSGGTTTISMTRGAGFYLAGGGWGPLPYAFGPVPAEEYRVLTLKLPAEHGRHQDKTMTIFGPGDGYDQSGLP